MSARDRGSATAELAAALPALVLLMLAGMTAVGATTAKAHCVDAARDAALAAARGEPAPGGAPHGAVVSVTVTGDTVTATVRAPVPCLRRPPRAPQRHRDGGGRPRARSALMNAVASARWRRGGAAPRVGGDASVGNLVGRWRRRPLVAARPARRRERLAVRSMAARRCSAASRGWRVGRRPVRTVASPLPGGGSAPAGRRERLAGRSMAARRCNAAIPGRWASCSGGGVAVARWWRRLGPASRTSRRPPAGGACGQLCQREGARGKATCSGGGAVGP